MSLTTVLARGRAAAEALMVDACIIRRVTGTTTDPDTGATTPTLSTLYTGKCRVQQSAPSASPAEVGEAYALMLRLDVQLPMSVVGLQTEDQIAVTASVHDPDLVGRVFLVRDLAHKSHATARRVGCVERTS
jgi:hypothetical protein